MADYTELRKLAEAATPGPWHYDGGNIARLSADNVRNLTALPMGSNGDYIAAANPQTVIALLDRIAELEKENERLVKVIDDCKGVCMKLAFYRDLAIERLGKQPPVTILDAQHKGEVDTLITAEGWLREALSPQPDSSTENVK